MTGNEYAKLIAAYVAKNYSARGVSLYTEVYLGTSIIGKKLRIDLLVAPRGTGAPLAIECKYQGGPGTADEKIPYILNDIAAMRVPACVSYAGRGFSKGVLHMLQSSELAAYCLPDESLDSLPIRRQEASCDFGTWQLDHVIAQAFGWWDLLVKGHVAVGGDDISAAQAIAARGSVESSALHSQRRSAKRADGTVPEEDRGGARRHGDLEGAG